MDLITIIFTTLLEGICPSDLGFTLLCIKRKKLPLFAFNLFTCTKSYNVCTVCVP